MLEILITSFMLSALIGMCLYQIIKLRIEFGLLKIKLSKNKLAIRMIYKKIQETDHKIDAIASNINTLSSVLSNFEKQYAVHESLSMRSLNDTIVQQYERAKKLLQHADKSDHDLLSSCDMTEEEIELLRDFT